MTILKKNKCIFYFIFYTALLINPSSCKVRNNSAEELVCIGMTDHYCVEKCLLDNNIAEQIELYVFRCGLKLATAGRTGYVLGNINSIDSEILLLKMYNQPEIFPGDSLLIQATGLLGLAYKGNIIEIENILETAFLITNKCLLENDLYYDILYDMVIQAISQVEIYHQRSFLLNQLQFLENMNRRYYESPFIVVIEKLLIINENVEVNIFIESLQNLIKDGLEPFQNEEILRFFRCMLYISSQQCINALFNIFDVLSQKDKLKLLEILECVTLENFVDSMDLYYWLAENSKTWNIQTQTRNKIFNEIKNEKRYWFVNGLNGIAPYYNDSITFSNLTK